MSGMNKRAAIKRLKNLVFTSKSDLTAFRAAIEKEFYSPELPNQVECRSLTIHGISCDMLIPQVSSTRRMILYVHGGSFMGGSKKAWRGFCSSLANESSSRVLVPEFRLAPEFAFPAAIEDILAAFKRMCDHHVDVFIAADGSGASIALAAALSIPQPLRKYFKGVLLFSPWLDLSSTAAFYKTKIKDPLFNQNALHFCAAYYTYSGNLENPLVSPLKADSSRFKGFPPVYIQTGSEELMLPSMQELDKKLKECGVDCRLEVYDGLFHFFQFIHEQVPQAHLAVEAAGKFIKNIEDTTDTQLEEDDLWN